MDYKLLSKGHQGIIVYPALNVYGNIDVKKYVTKIGTKKDIDNERNIYNALPDKFDKIIYDKECYFNTFLLEKSPLKKSNFLDKVKPDYNYELTIKYFPGKNLRDIIKDDFYIKNKHIYKLLKKIKLLYETMNKINTVYGIFHKDITLNNLMYNPETNEIRLIDFGMSSIRDVSNGAKKPHFYDKDCNDVIKVFNYLIDGFKKRSILKNIPKINNINELKEILPKIKEQLEHGPEAYYKK